MLFVTHRMLAMSVLGIAALGACTSGSASPGDTTTRAPSPTVVDPSPTAVPSVSDGPSAPSGSPGVNGSTTSESNGPGAVFATPTPGGSTPVMRYAWCLREKGLPAVVIEGNIAFDGGGGGSGQQQGPPANQADAEAACAKENRDYTPPNYNQR